MGSTDKFCLKWNDFESNISHSFKDLREQEQFFDVTLLADHSEVALEAHKVILSACSPFFRNALARQSPHPHPSIYLRGIKASHLQHCLDFMYYGEVNVGQEELNAFLAVAEDLQIKGLTQNNGGPVKSEPSSSGLKRGSEPPERGGPPPGKKRASMPPRPKSSTTSVPAAAAAVTVGDDDIQDVTPVKTEATAAVVTASGADVDETLDSGDFGEESYGDYGDYEGAEGGDMTGYEEGGAGPSGGGAQGAKVEIESYFRAIPRAGFLCLVCNKRSSSRYNMVRHIQSLHINAMDLACSLCAARFSTQNNRQIHYKHKHGLSLSMKEIKDMEREDAEREAIDLDVPVYHA